MLSNKRASLSTESSRVNPFLNLQTCATSASNNLLCCVPCLRAGVVGALEDAFPFGGGRVYYKSEKYFDVEALPSLWDKSVLPAKLPGNLTGVLCSRGAGEGECEVVVETVVEAAGVFVC
jgi:hypothetical protein